MLNHTKNICLNVLYSFDSGEKSEKTGQPINFAIDQTDAVRMEDVIRDLLTRADQVSLT